MNKCFDSLKRSKVDLLLFLFIILLVCNTSGCGIPSLFGVIQPLSVGDQWTYNYGIPSLSSESLTISITRTLEVDGVEVAESGNATYGYDYLSNHSDGLYIYGTSYGMYATPQLFRKYPCSVGDTWSDALGGTYEVQSISTSITVPAGTFDCIHYYYSYHNSTGHTEHQLYYCVGVGMVRQDIYLDSSHILFFELTSYSVL